MQPASFKIQSRMNPIDDKKNIVKYKEIPECEIKTETHEELSITHIKQEVPEHYSDRKIFWISDISTSTTCNDAKLKIENSHKNEGIEIKHSPVKCTKCDLIIKSAKNLKQHMIYKHTPDDFKWFNCEQCTFQAKRKDYLDAHLSAVHKVFTCDICGENFSGSKNFKEHIKITHTLADLPRPYACDQCFKNYMSERTLKKHIFVNHQTEKGAKWLYCHHCPYKSIDKTNLKRHIFGRHYEERPVHCTKCDYTTKTSAHLKVHMMHKHCEGEKSFNEHTCDYCSKNYVTLRNLKRHVLVYHQPDEEKWLYCDHCPHKCKEKTNLKRHIFSRHYKERPVKCSKCEYTAKHTAHLKVHMIYKHPSEGFKWFNCAQCSYKAKIAYSVKRHVAYVHSGSSSFKCDVCYSNFTTVTKLKLHVINKHMAENVIKWHECLQCFKRYKTKPSLKRHVQLKHYFGPANCNCTLESVSEDCIWFHCNHCLYRSITKYRVTRHVLNVHTTAREFKCGYCDTWCNIRENLNRHINDKHTSDELVKWHECVECSKKYKRKDQLVNHLNEKHRLVDQ